MFSPKCVQNSVRVQQNTVGPEMSDFRVQNVFDITQRNHLEEAPHQGYRSAVIKKALGPIRPFNSTSQNTGRLKTSAEAVLPPADGLIHYKQVKSSY